MTGACHGNYNYIHVQYACTRTCIPIHTLDKNVVCALIARNRRSHAHLNVTRNYTTCTFIAPTLLNMSASFLFIFSVSSRNIFADDNPALAPASVVFIFSLAASLPRLLLLLSRDCPRPRFGEASNRDVLRGLVGDKSESLSLL